MNKLTINQVALGSIKRRRGQYRAMIIGAGLAIFFVSALFLSVQSVYETQRLAHVARVGSQDAILLDCDRDPSRMPNNTVPATPKALLQSGLVSEVGSVYVIGETEDTKCPIGYYDETGAEMAGRSLIEGRLPEKPGEIAVEPNFLQKLRSDAALEDDIELTLNIPLGVRAQFLPDPVKKAYTIVGILKPQSIYLTSYYISDFEYLHIPSAIVSDKEQITPGGRAIVHRMVKLAPGVSMKQFESFTAQEYDCWNTMSTQFGVFGGMYSEDQGPGQIMVVIAAMLGVMLTLAACLGIVNAFSASLSERRSQIGMMRAVGATSRQIRSIFGREALLLALGVAPLSIALSYLFVWGLTKLTGIVAFHANPWFLPVDLLASLGCVALAAWIPLLGASKLPPMQAIREVSLLRARRRIRLRQQSSYSAPRLIASRHLTLYKTRQAGIAAMMALSMLMISAAVPFVSNLWGSQSEYGYQIRTDRWHMDSFVEQDVNPHEGLTDADVAEILSLPLISGADAASYAQINLLMDSVPPYAANIGGRNYWQDAPRDDIEAEALRYYKDFKANYKLTQEAYPNDLYALEDGVVESLAPYVLQGKIDIDALNAGREVLVFAPETYYQFEARTSGGYVYTRTEYQPPKGKRDVKAFTNDAFRAGDALSILRLFTRGGMSLRDDGTYDMLEGVQRQQTETRIGAVLGPEAADAMSEMGLYGFYTGNLITTHAGLRSLGLETAGYVCVGVRLSGVPDDSTHKYLTDQITGIAARGNMSLMNNIQRAKESTFWQAVLKAGMLAVLLLLLSMCVSLVNNAVTNRVRSDKRSIGTLRAVGAPLQDIVSSYRLQALAMVVWGVLTGALLSAGYFLWYLQSPVIGLSVSFGNVALAQSAFLGAVALLCGINLSARIREITRDSIVSNIREL